MNSIAALDAQALPEPPGRELTLHLVSDLDGTWLPAPNHQGDLALLEAFLAGHPGIVLTFATGRTLGSALAVLASLGAALPKYLIADVGTAIFQRDAQGRWRELEDYGQWVARRWNPVAVERALRGTLPAGVTAQAGVVPCRRLALEVGCGTDLRRGALALAESLAAAGVEADILPSAGHCLDVLPRGVHKGTAVEYLQARHGLPRPLVVCGDSGNDLGMLRIADVPVLMASSSLPPDAPGLDSNRLVQPCAPGPLGILATLRGLAAPEATP